MAICKVETERQLTPIIAEKLPVSIGMGNTVLDRWLRTVPASELRPSLIVVSKKVSILPDLFMA
jgi:hypothetical protein